jgi:hypothetical protein
MLDTEWQRNNPVVDEVIMIFLERITTPLLWPAFHL